MAIEFLKKLSFFFEPARLKIVYGGRGGGKTEGAHTALPIFANNKKLRILCCREFQNSIAQSSYQTLINCIDHVGLLDNFEIQNTKIISKLTNSEFLFAGLRHNIESIKSLAKIDIACTDEARNISKTSLDKLGPTIRGRHENDPAGMGGPFGLGPELWYIFNPELEDDEIYKRYVVKRQQYAPDFIAEEVSLEDQRFYYSVKEKKDNNVEINLTDLEKQRYNFIRNKRYAFVEKINYSDNKFFPPDLRREMILLKTASEDDYLHVWEGHTKQVLDGAIYAEEIRKVIKENRLGKVPYDSSRPMHTFWDLGRNDHTSIWFIQTVGMEFNVVDYYENRLKKMPWYIAILQEKKYVYGTHCLPHDGAAETLSNVTPEKQLRNMNIGKVRIIKRPAKKFVGINAVRSVFDLCNFSEENASEGFDCLRRYCYDVDENTGGFSKEPKHDEYSNGADGFQTFALSLKSETAAKKPERTIGVGRTVVPFRQSNSWMG